MPSTERRLRRIDERLPDTGGGAIVPAGGGAPAGAPAIPLPGAPRNVRIVETFLLHGQGQGAAGANVAWEPPTGVSPTAYSVQWDVAPAFTAPATRATPGGQTTIALDSMPTGATVYVRVAAIVQGVQGAWSATASAVTPADTTAPAAPTSLVTSWSGLTGDLTISWTNPTSPNFRDVRVRIYASNGGALFREVYVSGTTYLWTRGQHYADTGGVYDPSVYIVVTARSWGGVFSADLAGTATLAAPATPAGLTHSWAGDAGTAGAGLLVTWTQSAAVAGYRLSIDGVARDVGYTGRYDYPFAQNQAEHAGTADPVLSLSLVAVDALGQASAAATTTATNAAPPATTISVFAAFDRAGLTIAASAALDIKDYRVRVYVSAVLVDTFFTPDIKILYQAANGNGSYQFDVAARDLFNQLGAASALTTAETLEDVGAFVASLRNGAIYSDQLATNPETLFDAYTDDNRASGGVSYASNAGWVRWIRFERPDRDRYRTVTLSMSPASGTTNWYIRTSEDAAAWSYFAGPVTSGRILTSVASAAAAQSAAVSAATLGGPTTSRVDLPSLVSARYVEVWLRNTGAATTVREFYPRRLVQSDDLEAEAVKAVNIAASAITAGAIAAGAIDGFVITGATIRTASSGARAELTVDGLTTYNAAGQVVLRATTATDGALKAYTTTGVAYFTVGPAGPQILATNAAYDNARGFSFTDGAGAVRSGIFGRASGNELRLGAADGVPAADVDLQIFVDSIQADIDGPVQLFMDTNTWGHYSSGWIQFDAPLNVTVGGTGTRNAGLALETRPGYAVIDGALGVGAIAGGVPASGQIRASSAIHAGGAIGGTNGGLLPSLYAGNTSDNTEWVGIGYYDFGDYGFIQAVDDNAGYKTLSIQPSGGSLALGSSGAAIGFLGASPATRPNVTGSRGGNAALASLLTALNTLGLINNSTSA